MKTMAPKQTVAVNHEIASRNGSLSQQRDAYAAGHAIQILEGGQWMARARLLGRQARPADGQSGEAERGLAGGIESGNDAARSAEDTRPGLRDKTPNLGRLMPRTLTIGLLCRAVLRLLLNLRGRNSAGAIACGSRAETNQLANPL